MPAARQTGIYYDVKREACVVFGARDAFEWLFLCVRGESVCEMAETFRTYIFAIGYPK